MKLNNEKHIKGIFLFNSGLELDKDDFVVYKNSMFICTCNVVTTEDETPDKDFKHYKPYLYKEEATWEEFSEFFNTGTYKTDNIITSKVLSQILKKLNFGIDSTGIITEEVMKNYISPGLGELTEGYINVLDQLILSPKVEMNNLTIKVDRNIPGCLITIKPDNLIDDEDFKSVLLKQYTYREASNTESGKVTYRVQELIDPFFGINFYRFAKLSEYEDEGSISSWKQSNISGEFLDKLTAFYIELKEKINSKDRFNFIKINKGESTLINNGEKQYSVDLTNYDIVTVTITGKLGNEISINSVPKNYSITVAVDGNSYAFPIHNSSSGDVTVNCTKNAVTLKYGGNDFEILDIYARQTTTNNNL